MYTAIDSRRRMESLYGEFVQANSKRTLTPANVPQALQPWIPYAELWGIEDDYDRDRLVVHAPKAARDDLVAVVRQIDDALDEWLAGDEATGTVVSDEYCAFSTMRMAADYASQL